jgi:cell division protein FtsW
VLTRVGTPQLLVAATLLLGGGLVMIYSASAARAELLHGSPWFYLGRQLLRLLTGCAAALLLARIPLPWLARLGYVAWGGALIALIATLTPLGVTQNGARRWLEVGGLCFQPLELVKLGLVLGVAQWLAGREKRMADFRVSILVPALFAAIPAAVLLLQPDFGGAVLLALFAGIMVYAAGARLDHLAATAVLGVPTLVTVGLLADYRLYRWRGFIDPFGDPLGHGYQLMQSVLAFGAGGLTGAGFGSSQQKLFYLPEAHSDFILSVVGEETGLIGVTCMLGCFALLGLASLGIASRAKSTFGMLVAVGASALLWAQAMVNAGVAMGMLPTKGTTLPLVSYGGTSLVISLAAFGLVLNVARPTRRGRSGWR